MSMHSSGTGIYFQYKTKCYLLNFTGNYKINFEIVRNENLCFNLLLCGCGMPINFFINETTIFVRS